jgi:hypothetical protein
MILETHIQGIPCQVKVEYQQAYRGYRERLYGIQLEPDEPAHYEITGIYNHKDKKCKKSMQWLWDKLTVEDHDRISNLATRET